MSDSISIDDRGNVIGDLCTPHWIRGNGNFILIRCYYQVIGKEVLVRFEDTTAMHGCDLEVTGVRVGR